jgi:hypothetical protein
VGRHGGVVARVAIVAFRRRELDRDNLIGGCKALRDAIAGWLGLDDSEHVVEWTYSQHITRGQRGCAVRIETL